MESCHAHLYRSLLRSPWSQHPDPGETQAGSQLSVTVPEDIYLLHCFAVYVYAHNVVLGVPPYKKHEGNFPSQSCFSNYHVMSSNPRGSKMSSKRELVSCGRDLTCVPDLPEALKVTGQQGCAKT